MVPVIVSIGNLTRICQWPTGVATSGVSAVPVLTKVVSTICSPSYAQRRCAPSETTTSSASLCHRPGPGSTTSWASAVAGAERARPINMATRVADQTASARAGRGRDTAGLLLLSAGRSATRVLTEHGYLCAHGQLASLQPAPDRVGG